MGYMRNWIAILDRGLSAVNESDSKDQTGDWKQL
jgi:hypothetical protein